MPKYLITGENFRTGKRDRWIYEAATEADAADRALNDGIASESIVPAPDHLLQEKRSGPAPVGDRPPVRRIRASMICPNCGRQGNAVTMTRGSIFIEIFLWLMLFIPGLIYSIWRLTTRYKACPNCGAKNMVPTDSPRGRKLIEEFE